jgi:phospholipid/cholesterol/gamma-HCH transport system permease protein
MDDWIMQADLIGVGSLSIVVMTGFFTGAVLALQTSKTLEQFGSLSLTGQVVSLSMVRELGPVLTGLMVAGRNASGMASELGSMVVTEQIDAMRALGTDPLKKLVTPRVVATVVMLFFLTIISDIVGIGGGFMVSSLVLRLDAQQYWTNAYQELARDDLIMGLLKPLFFGFVIATVGCYYGLTARGGTQGVGRATTQAVVAASVLILAVNFFLTRFLITWVEK